MSVLLSDESSNYVKSVSRHIEGAKDHLTKPALFEIAVRVTWECIRTGDTDRTESWRDALGKSKSLYSLSSAEPLYITQLEALGRILDHQLMFQQHHCSKQLLQRTHTMKILRFLATHNGEVPRNQLLTSLNLKEANGSRILNVLELAGWIQRKKSGRNISVSLTPDGFQQVSANRAKVSLRKARNSSPDKQRELLRAKPTQGSRLQTLQLNDEIEPCRILEHTL